MQLSRTQHNVFYDITLDRLLCLPPGVPSEVWQPNDDPMAKHRQLYPDCGFVRLNTEFVNHSAPDPQSEREVSSSLTSCRVSSNIKTMFHLYTTISVCYQQHTIECTCPNRTLAFRPKTQLKRMILSLRKCNMTIYIYIYLLILYIYKQVCSLFPPSPSPSPSPQRADLLCSLLLLKFAPEEVYLKSSFYVYC